MNNNLKEIKVNIIIDKNKIDDLLNNRGEYLNFILHNTTYTINEDSKYDKYRLSKKENEEIITITSYIHYYIDLKQDDDIFTGRDFRYELNRLDGIYNQNRYFQHYLNYLYTEPKANLYAFYKAFLSFHFGIKDKALLDEIIDNYVYEDMPLFSDYVMEIIEKYDTIK